jgi:putative membrane protein
MIAAAAAVPEPFGPSSLLTQWNADPWTLLPLAGVLLLYAGGVRRLRRAGRPLPRDRVIAFACGMAALVIALASPLDAYADVSFAVHMAQHLLLALVAPPLLALGSPIRLALRASSPEARRRLLVPLLRSRPASVLSLPLVGWALFVSVPFFVHLSPLFDAALRRDGLHALEHAIWLAAALIYWWPVVGRDPTPHPVGYPARLLSLTMTMPAQAFLALAIYTASAPLYPSYLHVPAPWGAEALADQRAAAVMMWVAGNLIIVVAIALVAAAWRRDDDARQRRLERRDADADTAAQRLASSAGA